MGSEYGGTGPRKQPVQPKGVGAMTAGEKVLMINYSGGVDPYLPTDDHRTWEGLDIDYGKTVIPPLPATPDPFDDTGGA